MEEITFVGRAIDRLALIVLGFDVVLLGTWLAFHPLVVVGLQAALAGLAMAWRVAIHK